MRGDVNGAFADSIWIISLTRIVSDLWPHNKAPTTADGVYTGAMATAVRLVDPSENEFLASLEARAKQANLFFRAMAHRPEVLKNFPPLYTAIVGPGSVARRLKVLVYLACSYANRCAYCISSNLPGAHKAGITGEELVAVEAERNELFPEIGRASGRERAWM